MDEYYHTYSININQTSYIYADLCSSNYDTIVTLYDANLSVIADNDDSTACPQRQSLLLHGPLAKGDYFIQVSGWNKHTGDYTIKLSCPLIEQCMFCSSYCSFYFNIQLVNTMWPLWLIIR